jgi:ribosomal protein S18 acetylase RimI-like enzyme
MRTIIITESQLARIEEVVRTKPMFYRRKSKWDAKDEVEDNQDFEEKPEAPKKEIVPSGDEVSVSDDESDSLNIVKSHVDDEHWRWMHDPKQLAKILGSDIKHVEYSLSQLLAQMQKGFGYNLKRVLITDRDVVVGYFIWATEGKSIDDLGDGKKYPVIINTAIHPSYRGRGLFTKMLQKANLQRPFLVHIGVVSPIKMWEKLGCKPVKNVGQGNFISKCE